MITLILPEPPSVNRLSSNGMARHQQKRRYQRDVWVLACLQRIPPADAPELVRVDAHFRLHQLRDEDNLAGSLKFVLDCLRAKQTSRKWRRGLYENRGYFVDDDPSHLTLGEVTQEIDRKDRGVTLTIAPVTTNGMRT